MNVNRLSAIAIALFLTALSCNQMGTPNDKEVLLTRKSDMDLSDTVAFAGTGLTGKPDSAGPRQKSQQLKDNGNDWDKRIIKDASVRIRVPDFGGFGERLRDKVKAAGGYIAAEDRSQNEYKITNQVTIKVPVNGFEDALASILDDSVTIEEKKIRSQDVTGEIIDIRSRTESKKQVREKYRDFLRQARNMNDMLLVQREINSVQEEIEAASGRIDYLSHASAFSTINLNFFQVLNPLKEPEAKPGFAAKLFRSFRDGWVFMGDLLIALVSVWPLAFFIGVIYFAFRRHGRMLAAKKEKASDM